MLTFRTLDALHFFLYPLLNWILKPFAKGVANRIKFENKNIDCQYCRSFKLDHLKAQVCYEVSSEGELEQVKPLIQHDLDSNRLVELVFCSDSVERQCLSLAKNYPDNLRIYRLPLATYKPWGTKNNLRDWMSSDVLFLCRYDFFPELILLGRNVCRYFGLFSASLKGKDLNKQGYFKSNFYKYVYESFNFLTTPTSRDKSLIQIHYNIEEEKVKTVDFRVLQIVARQKNTEETLLKRVPGWSILRDYLEDNRKKGMIFGSFWPSEVELFNDSFFDQVRREELLPLLAPHNLSAEYIGRIKLNLKSKSSDLKIYEINEDDDEQAVEKVLSSLKESPGVLLMNIKGALCELYQFYNLAFVGGGHGRSVHSLLEPYLGGCNLICGPKVHRSTEYDIILEKSVEHIKVINDSTELNKAIFSLLNKNIDRVKRREYIEDTQVASSEVKRVLESLYDKK